MTDQRSELIELIFKENLKMDAEHISKGCRECAEGLANSILKWHNEKMVEVKIKTYEEFIGDGTDDAKYAEAKISELKRGE
jgi:hypothetical protein